MAIQFLRGTSSQRASSSKILAGQPFYETDTGKLYVASGTTSTTGSLTDANSFTPTSKFKAASGAASSTSQLPTPQPNTLYKVDYVKGSSSRGYDLVWTGRTLSAGASGLNRVVSVSSSGEWSMPSNCSPVSWSAVAGSNLTPPDPLDTATSLAAAADFEIYFEDTLGIFKVITTSKTDYSNIKITLAALTEDQDVLVSEVFTLPPMGVKTTTYLSTALNTSEIDDISEIYGLSVLIKDQLNRVSSKEYIYTTSNSAVQSWGLTVPEPSFSSKDYVLSSATTLRMASYENGGYIDETLLLCEAGYLQLIQSVGPFGAAYTSSSKMDSVRPPLNLWIPSTSQSSSTPLYIKFQLSVGSLYKEPDSGIMYVPKDGDVSRVQIY